MHRNQIKFLYWMVIVILLIIASLIVCAPYILSTKKGTGALVHYLNKQKTGVWHIDSMQLKWGKGQQIQNLSLTSMTGEPILSFPLVKTDASLFTLLTGRLDLGHCQIINPSIVIASDNNDSSNLQNALSDSPSTQAHKAKPSAMESTKMRSLKGQVEIQNGSLTFLQPGISPLYFNQIDLNLLIPKKSDPMQWTLHCNSIQDETNGGLNSTGRCPVQLLSMKHFTDFWKTLKVHDGPDPLIVQLQARNFPLGGIDQVMTLKNKNWKGLVTDSLGKSIDIQAEVVASKAQSKLSILADSNTLKANIQGNAVEDLFTMNPNSVLVCQVTPGFIDDLIQNDLFPLDARLNATFPLLLTINQLQFPLSSDFDINHVLLQCDLTTDPSHWQIPDSLENNFDILAVESQVELNPATHTAVASLLVDIKAVNVAPTMRLQMNATGGVPFKNDLSVSNLTFNCVATNLSTPWLTKVASLPFDATPLLSTPVNLQLQGTAAAGQTGVTLNVHSPTLKTQQIQFTLTDALRLAQSTTIEWMPPLNNADYPPYQVNLKLPLKVTIQDLTLPLDFKLNNATLNATVMGGPLVVSQEGQGQPIATIDTLQAQINALHLTNPEINIQSSLKTEQLPFQLASILGPTTTVNAKLMPVLSDRAELQNLEAHVQIQSFSAKTAIDLACDKQGNWKLSNPAVSEFIAGNELYHTLFPISQFSLNQPIKVTLNVDQAQGTLNPFILQQLNGRLECPQVDLSYGQEFVRLTPVAIQFKADPNTLWASLNTSTVPSGTMTGDLTASNFFKNGIYQWDQATYITHAKCMALPTALIESFTGQGEHLTELIGPTVEVALDGECHLDRKEMGNMNLAISAEGLNCQGNLILASQVRLSSPFKISWMITPSRFDALQKMYRERTPLQLEQTTAVTVQINGLNFPIDFLKQSPSLNWSQSKIDLTATVAPMTLTRSGTEDKAMLNKWIFDLETDDKTQSLDLTLKGSIATSGSGIASHNGSIDLHATGDNWVDDNGALAFSQMDATIDTKIKDMSLDWLMQVASIDTPAADTLLSVTGPTINSTIVGQFKQMQGPITADISSEFAKASLKGQLQEGVLTLTDPFQATLELNPEMGSDFLKQVNPLLNSGLRADTPLTLSIQPAGFALPLFPFSLQQCTIGNATFNPGIIYTKTKGSPLLGILSFLKMRQGLDQNELKLWCTPVFFSIQNGVAEYQRMDILINDTIHIANWGSIDLIRDQVNMTLGIPQNTLSSAFGLRSLTPNYMFIIPMRGTTSNVSIDWTKATLRIGTLIARSTGIKGKVFGTVFDLVTGGSDSVSPPPPSVQPFPWDNQGQSE